MGQRKGQGQRVRCDLCPEIKRKPQAREGHTQTQAGAALERAEWERAGGEVGRPWWSPDWEAKAEGKRTLWEIFKSYPSLLRGLVNGKPIQGPFLLHTGLRALLY